MKHPNPNMMLRIAQADAYGIAREFVKKKDFKKHVDNCLKFECYLQHPFYGSIKPGDYTDDTQMSIAVAETLIKYGTDVSDQRFRDAFFETFKRDWRDGYSRKFQKILEDAKTSDHLKALIIPTSNGNGAAMRSVPLGIIRDPRELVKIAEIQAKITHDSWGGINSSISVALMSHFALYDHRDFTDMYQWCIQWNEAHGLFYEYWKGPIQENSNDGLNLGLGMNTVWAVQTLLETETSLIDIMKRIIKWGGDTDSVAAIAWGIASCRYQNERLPQFFERDLEMYRSEIYGVEFLKNLGHQLMIKNNKLI